MSDVSMAEKFGRQKKWSSQKEKFTADFEVEGYLRYRGDNFVKRFDANSYLYITKAIDHFDGFAGKTVQEAFQHVKGKVLVIAFKSDWLYPSYQSQEIVKACKIAGLETSYCEIESTYGHDAFLLEIEEESHLIQHFLKKVFYDYEVTDGYAI
jgi:homoserine O-acetyltransferase